ncbi:MAG: M50 family metallopeptidase [Chloroflexota bacterium]|nr:M50 family metallopeptidase [Chloroflexota bacterium]
MNGRLRLFWGLLLVLSLVWIIAGSVLTSAYFDDGNLGEEVAAGIRAFGSARDIDALATLPLPIVFIASGLPFALIALFFLRRSNKRAAAAAALDPEIAIRRQALLVSALALVFALFLWNMRAAPGQAQTDIVTATLSPLLWPVRLFVTFVHEAGHSLAALITGGQVLEFTVSPDGSGYARTAGGYTALILPAGYLGAALFGSALFFLTSRYPKWTRGLSVFLGLAVIILTLLFAAPDPSGNLTANVIGIGFGVAMVALGWLAPRILNVFILNTLAILTSLNAVMDLSFLVRFGDAGVGDIRNDAAAFAAEYTPLLPASVIAFIWSAVAVIMLGAAVYFGLIKQVGGEISDAVKGKN